MVNEFETSTGPVQWASDDRDLRITYRGRVKRLRWDEITRAGLVQFPGAHTPPGFPREILPGLGKLLDIYQAQAKDYRQLALARGRSSFRAVRVPVSLGDPGAMALVEEVSRRLDVRWVGEVPMGAFAALLSGDVLDAPLAAWLALLFWLALIGGILFLYRRRR